MGCYGQVMGVLVLVLVLLVLVLVLLVLHKWGAMVK
jgi:hypothetical protein